MKKILITGKHSYIGTAVEKWLESRPGFVTETLDMKSEAWEGFDFTGYDTVFHVAGIAHADTGNITEERKRLYYHINGELAGKTAEKAKESGVKQFIYMSSIIIYGESGGIGEKKVIGRATTPSPSNAYGDSKWEGDKRVRALADPGFRVAVIRAPMIYGEGCKGNYRLLEKIAERAPAFPNIRNERSLLHISLLCETVEKLIVSGKGGIYFPQDREYGNTADMVKKLAEEKGKRIWVTSLLNPFVYMAAALPGKKIRALVKKAFGSMVYEKGMDMEL